MIKAEAPCRKSAMVVFDAHVRARKKRSGQTDEGGQGNQKDVERVNEELFVKKRHRAISDHADSQHSRRQQGKQAAGRVELGSAAAVAKKDPAARP